MSTQAVKNLQVSDVKVGDALPEQSIPVTTTMIVAGALATQDFTPVHHDKAAAQKQGLSDIIMNTMTTNGLVSRFVTDWAGPNALLERIALKLGAPNNPGDTMKMRGVVKAVDAAAHRVEVSVNGTNSWGDHVTATVTLRLERGA
jgi:acyl dehydratase